MLQFHKKNYRIGLDIDEVCANFLNGYSKLTNKDYSAVKNFSFSYNIFPNLEQVGKEFWLNLEPKVDPSRLPFLPTVYISTRRFHTVITEEWLETNGFPCAPVVHVTDGKVEAMQKWNLDFFIDDYIKNFQELNEAGIKTLLMDCVHNRQYNVGNYRLSSLYELPAKIAELGW